MRIAFITGSLEPGRDGVGDYAAGLAAELRLRDHNVIVIALGDKYLSEVVSADRQVGGGSIQTLRFPSDLPWTERIQRAASQLDCFDPEWVSLQFVCYGFHPKGLVYGLGRRLTPLINSRKLHIMFHEIWLCKELGLGWKQCAVGALQRFFIQCFVRGAKPNVMHTSNATYAALLNRSGIPAKELGLFGNVPILSEPGTVWVESRLRTVLGDGYCRKAVWLFGFFGAIHARWPPEPLLTHLHQAAHAAGKKAVILSIGSTGQAGLDLWNRMAHRYSDRFTFIRLGQQPTEFISEYLLLLDYGIATSPRSIIGKSGTVISMLEHGLPVIVNRDDAPGMADSVQKAEPLFIACDRNLEMRLQRGLTKGPCVSRRPQTANSLLSSLGEALTLA